MSNLLYTSQAKSMLNIASAQDLANLGTLSSIYTGTTGSPNSSGLTTTIASGTATLTNTTSYFYTLASTTLTRTLYPNSFNQYINIYDRSANAPTPCAFTYNIGGGSPAVGSFISIHIDASCLTTDTFTIKAGSGTSSNPPATAPGDITCYPGATYTFICFVVGLWTRM